MMYGHSHYSCVCVSQIQIYVVCVCVCVAVIAYMRHRRLSIRPVSVYPHIFSIVETADGTLIVVLIWFSLSFISLTVASLLCCVCVCVRCLVSLSFPRSTVSFSIHAAYFSSQLHSNDSPAFFSRHIPLACYFSCRL